MIGKPATTIERAVTRYLEWVLLHDLILRDRFEERVDWLNRKGHFVRPQEAHVRTTLAANYNYEDLHADVEFLVRDTDGDARAMLFLLPTVAELIDLHWAFNDQPYVGGDE